MAETIKAYSRRIRENFFHNYIVGKGIDIGCGRINNVDLIDPTAMPWDKDNGDATFMKSIKDNTFDYVYSSHCLEHIDNCYLAIKNWFRIVKSTGHLIIAVPDRDLYEKKKDLPSKWNKDHKFFFLLDKEELPYTLNFTELLIASLDNYKYSIEYIKQCNENYVSNDDNHSGGEYSLEAVIKKL